MGGRFSTTRLSPGPTTPAPDCPAGPPCASAMKDANKITKLADSRFIFSSTRFFPYARCARSLTALDRARQETWIKQKNRPADALLYQGSEGKYYFLVNLLSRPSLPPPVPRHFNPLTPQVTPFTSGMSGVQSDVWRGVRWL